MPNVELLDPSSLTISIDAHGFQEVLDALPAAESVLVVTYNLDPTADAGLLGALADVDGPVKIVTNIPGRFEQYFGDAARAGAGRRIRSYIKMMSEAEESLPNAEFFLHFGNHSKLVATHAIAYVGSANFSEASAANVEAGVVFRGEASVARIREALWATLTPGLIPFYKRGTPQRASATAAVFRAAAEPLVASLAQILERGDEWFDGEDWSDAAVHLQAVEDAVDALRYTIDDGLTDDRKPNELLRKHVSIDVVDDIGNLVWDDAVRRFARFDGDGMVHQIIARDCSDEEQLDAIASSAQGDADEARVRLFMAAVAPLTTLLNKLRELEDAFTGLDQEVRALAAAVDAIDNT